jgi:molybdopterin biosynthesis enzyme
MSASEPSEGKIEIRAEIDGILKINTDRLNAVNSLGEMMIATVHGNFPVKKGDKIAATRIIPLVIENEKMENAKAAAGEEPLLKILPFRHVKTGIVITGSEVSKGRIKDSFGPAVIAKLSEYDTQVIGQRFPGDDREEIIRAIHSFIDEGADMVLCTGGMSVDPDDRTPGAIKDAGVEVVSYGAPVLPGAMFLMGYYGKNIPVMGLPGCVMYAGRTIFDLVLPRVIAGDRITAHDLSTYGEGGLCLNCPVCHFPNCGFGK